MQDEEVAKYWEANAEAWTALSRAGYDICRDLYNTPTFLRILPNIEGLVGLDIGCGEGHNTRLLAGRGAHMSALDIASTFVRHAREAEINEPLGIEFHEGSAIDLPFENEQFDFATAFMSLQDISGPQAAISEAYRVIRPGGFFQFSMTHPCFHTPKWGWVTNEEGERVAATVGDYFDRKPNQVDEWIFGGAPEDVKAKYPKFKIPNFERTLSAWMSMLLTTGFQLEEFAEPYPSDEVLESHPRERDARIVGFFLIVRCRKPHRLGT